MVADPAWFPSAAMQTVGAMYAIFVAVYVLFIQRGQELGKRISKASVKLFLFFIVFSFNYNLYKCTCSLGSLCR